MPLVKTKLAVIEKDRGWKRLKEDLKKAALNSHVDCGLQGESAIGTNGGPSLADIATFNEFGVPSRGIPARPLFRNTVALHGKEWNQRAQELLKEILTVNPKMTIERALGLLGEMVINDLKRYYVDPGFKGTIPNAPATIARKKSDVPLIDTGRTRNAITYKVVRDGKAGRK